MTDEPTQYDFDSPQSLMATANQPELQASEKPLYARVGGTAEHTHRIHARDDFGDEVPVEQLEDFKLIYNEATGRKFNAVTSEYEVINPPQFIGPMIEELQERDRTDIQGDVTVRNGGAQAFMQLTFENTGAIWLPNRGRSDPVRVGFETRWSHDGGISVRAQGFAQDTACTNSIREVTSGIHVKHAGDGDRVDWRDEWASVLDEVGAFSEMLGGVIEEALEVEMFDFAPMNTEPLPSEWWEAVEDYGPLREIEHPPTVSRESVERVYGFFNLLGFPRYLACAATDRLMWRLFQTEDALESNAWDVYSAATYALTHEFRGTQGASDDDKFRTARDLLMNPELARREVTEAAASELTDVEGRPGVPQGEVDGAIEESAGDALRTESERSRQLAETFDA